MCQRKFRPIKYTRRYSYAKFGTFFRATRYILFIFNDSVRPIISTSTGPIFTQFAGIVELRLYMNSLKLFFDLSKDVAVANNFVGNIDLQSLHLTLVRVSSARYRRTARSVLLIGL